jgi:hypothetical protein
MGVSASLIQQLAGNMEYCTAKKVVFLFLSCI